MSLMTVCRYAVYTQVDVGQCPPSSSSAALRSFHLLLRWKESSHLERPWFVLQTGNEEAR